MDLLKGLQIPSDKINGEIRFENVCFSYPSRPDQVCVLLCFIYNEILPKFLPKQVVLKDFNLVLKPGQTVALVGSSGSGKSTIASLLERFYEPTSGSITIDGYPINGNFNPETCRFHFHYIANAFQYFHRAGFDPR